MSVTRGADLVNFTLLERSKRVKYVPTPEEVASEERRKEKRAHSWRRNDWNSVSFGSTPPWPNHVTEWTGELVFAMDVWADGLRKSNMDGAAQRWACSMMKPDRMASPHG